MTISKIRIPPKTYRVSAVGDPRANAITAPMMVAGHLITQVPTGITRYEQTSHIPRSTKLGMISLIIALRIERNNQIIKPTVSAFRGSRLTAATIDAEIRAPDRGNDRMYWIDIILLVSYSFIRIHPWIIIRRSYMISDTYRTREIDMERALKDVFTTLFAA